MLSGESHAIDNAGVLPTVRNSPSYKLGKPIAESDQFQYTDKAALDITNSGIGSKTTYSQGIVVDGKSSGAGTLVRLIGFKPGIDPTKQLIRERMLSSNKEKVSNALRIFKEQVPDNTKVYL